MCKRWLDRPFFIPNMTIHNKNLAPFFAFALLLTISLSAFPSTAEAGFFDWFSGTNSNETNSNQGHTPSLAFLSSDTGISSSTQTDNHAENSISIVQDNYIIQNGRPEKEKTNAILFLKSESLVVATAYSSTPDQTDDSPFITALGTTVRDGIIAANFLSLGTKVKIPSQFGDKIFVVEDRMNQRYSNRVDIWYPDRESAKQFGIRIVKIQVLGK